MAWEAQGPVVAHLRVAHLESVSEAAHRAAAPPPASYDIHVIVQLVMVHTSRVRAATQRYPPPQRPFTVKLASTVARALPFSCAGPTVTATAWRPVLVSSTGPGLVVPNEQALPGRNGIRDRGMPAIVTESRSPPRSIGA